MNDSASDGTDDVFFYKGIRTVPYSCLMRWRAHEVNSTADEIQTEP